MMFRKLYWVSEHVDATGRSSVVGVYTSIPDLIRYGLRWIPGENSDQLRITLTKLDSAMPPLGVWNSPDFQSLSEDLEPYIKTEEFSLEHCEALRHALLDTARAMAPKA